MDPSFESGRTSKKKVKGRLRILAPRKRSNDDDMTMAPDKTCKGMRCQGQKRRIHDRMRFGSDFQRTFFNRRSRYGGVARVR